MSCPINLNKTLKEFSQHISEKYDLHLNLDKGSTSRRYGKKGRRRTLNKRGGAGVGSILSTIAILTVALILKGTVLNTPEKTTTKSLIECAISKNPFIKDMIDNIMKLPVTSKFNYNVGKIVESYSNHKEKYDINFEEILDKLIEIKHQTLVDNDTDKYLYFDSLYTILEMIQDKKTVTADDNQTIKFILEKIEYYRPVSLLPLPPPPAEMTLEYYPVWVSATPKQRLDQLTISSVPGGMNYYSYIPQRIIYKPDSELILPDTNPATLIPPNLFLFWHTSDLQPGMEKNKQLLERKFSRDTDGKGVTRFFDIINGKEEIENAVRTATTQEEEIFMKSILITYNALQTYAYKSDLFRYFVLYKYGGVYLDIKFEPTNKFNFGNYVGKSKEVFAQDGPDIEQRRIYNAFLISKQNSTVMYNVIQLVIKHIYEGYKGPNPLSPTGPDTFAEVLCDYTFQYPKSLVYYPIKKGPQTIDSIIDSITSELLFERYGEYRIEQQTTGIIEDLWNYNKAWEDNTYVFGPALKLLDNLKQEGVDSFFEDFKNTELPKIIDEEGKGKKGKTRKTKKRT